MWFKSYKADQNEKASTAMAKAQDNFMKGNYELALNGDSTGVAGFLKVASEYGSTDAGNLAQLYIGICQANLGKWQEAVNALESFSGKGDQMISPAAEGALGNAYANLNQLDKAVDHLKKAAKMADNNSLSPTFLIQAGEILESQGKKEEALKLYEEVKEKYFNSMQYQSIDKYIERAKN
jgi:tetratricopeptide (TPR) repeat protein